MSLMVNSGQNSSSFSKHPAIGLDKGAAPWARGLYLEQLPLPTSVLSTPHSAWPRGWTTKAKPQARGRKQV